MFSTLGFNAATVRDIIRETDLAAGTFYNYFKSKDEVYEAIARDFARKFGEQVRSFDPTSLSLEEYISELFRSYFTFIASEAKTLGASGEPGMAVVSVRIDAPEIQTIFGAIRRNMVLLLKDSSVSQSDVESFVTSAIAVGRDLGHQMLLRDRIDPVKTADFATNLLFGGAARLGITD